MDSRTRKTKPIERIRVPEQTCNAKYIILNLKMYDVRLHFSSKGISLKCLELVLKGVTDCISYIDNILPSEYALDAARLVQQILELEVISGVLKRKLPYEFRACLDYFSNS